MEEKYRKRFHNGDIVYWCHKESNGYRVKFGMVYEQFSDAVIIDYLVPRERRLVNGTPIEEFKSEERYRKLPKGWSWNTRLYEITYRDFTDEENDCLIDISVPETIKEAYDKGFLVKDSTIFHGVIESEISKDGYRIVKKYPMWEHHIDHVSILPYKVYSTYEEAKEEVNTHNNELKRQAALSDLEWAIEQIDKQLDRWKLYSSCSNKEIQGYRDFLLAQDNVEDIEVRIVQGGLQWKYWNKKRWNYIEVIE